VETPSVVKNLLKKLSELDPSDQDAIIEAINNCKFRIPYETDPAPRLKKWDNVKRASPGPMTDEEYKKFILGYN